jgi:threonine dehydrogenase-like Zn-dependent dehydrogenase
MKAFVMERIGEVGFAEKDIPEPGRDGAVVRATKAAVCTSDVHTAHGGVGERENLTLGHEAVGIVHEVGPEVEDFSPGDRVAVAAVTPEWGSLPARDGYPSQTGGPLQGWKLSNVKDGTFAEYFHVNEADANLAQIPDGVTDEEAVYVADMINTGFEATEKADVPMGGTVAVFGQGPVGLMATKGADLSMAGTVVTVETVPERKDLSRTYGADEVVDYEDGDPVDQILDLPQVEDRGVDSAVCAVGDETAFGQAIAATKAGGTIANIGYMSEGEYVRIPREEWGYGMAEKKIVEIQTQGGRLKVERLLRLLRSGRVDPTHLTSHEFSIDEADEAFELMESKEDDVIKPLINFD